MSRASKGPSPNRWNSVTLRMLRWVDSDRGAEIRAHVEDATEAGEPLGPGDASSVLGLAARTQLSRSLEQVRLVAIGMPVALLCVMAYGAIYESHFAPWDLMEEFSTTNAKVAFIRGLVEIAWIVLVPLGLFTGWSVVKSVRSRRFALPGIYILGLIVLARQSNIFIERTEWFGNETLQASDVNTVSPYSLGLFSLVFLLPLAYLVLETVSRRRRGRSRPADVQSGQMVLPLQDTIQAGPEQRQIDSVALAAVFAPLLTPLVPLIPLVLFLVLVLVAPTFGLRHKVAAIAVIVAPVVAVAATWSEGGIDDPGLGGLLLLILFVAVWGWLTVVTLGSGGHFRRIPWQWKRLNTF